jgi:hypothetical protein
MLEHKLVIGIIVHVTTEVNSHVVSNNHGPPRSPANNSSPNLMKPNPLRETRKEDMVSSTK